MISALSWVPRGVAKAVPLAAEPTEEELNELKLRSKALVGEVREEEDEDKEEEEEVDDEDESGGDEDEEDMEEEAEGGRDGDIKGNKGARGHTDDLANELAELDMDKYDEEDADVAGSLRLFGSGGFGGAYYVSNDDDPYITLKENDDEDEDEIDDFTIRPTDSIVLTARNEDDVSMVEVWVCEEPEEEDEKEINLYVHHDIILPAFPLCLAWLDLNPQNPSPSERGNVVAVGCMQPGIEIWNLDIMDEVEPIAVLGGADKIASQGVSEAKKGGKKSKKGAKLESVKLKDGSHEGAVLGLSWNSEFRNVLASAGEDGSVRVWDVVKESCEHVLAHHNDKVQAVAWNPLDAPLLLSGSFDKTIALVDARAPTQAAKIFSLSADVESLAWDPHSTNRFVVSTEDGFVRAFDTRHSGNTSSSSEGATSNPLFLLHAHDKAACAVSFNPRFRDFLATSSTDKTVKLWDLANDAPSCVASENPKLGAIFTISFCGDSSYWLAMGGSKGKLHVWNTRTNSAVVKRFRD